MAKDLNEGGRNRLDTQARILAAASELLINGGAAAFGVNAVARAANCDKQLIYRYFDGVDGLLAAIGQGVAARLTKALEPWLVPAPVTYEQFVLALAKGLLAAYRADPLLARIRAWEFSGGGVVVAKLVAARGAAMGAWIAKARPSGLPVPYFDVVALNALVVGAVEIVALSAATSGGMIGIDLKDEAGWDRIEDALERLVDGAYRTMTSNAS
jgi:AcrR family transcriptional regulator